MPVTANEVDSYKGDANIAFGSSSVPGGTGVVWDLGVSDKAWADFAQNKLRVAMLKDAQLKAKQLQAQKDFNDIDPSKYKFWYKDNAYAAKAWEDWRKVAIPVMKSGNWENINDPNYVKAKEMLDNLIQDSQYSMQQEAHHTIGDSEYKKNPKDYLPASQASVDAYANAKSPRERAAMDYVLYHQIDNDIIKTAAAIEKAITTGMTSHSVASKDQYGQIVNDITTSQKIDLEKLPSTVKGLYDTDPSWRSQADEVYSMLTPEQQAQIGNDPSQTLVEKFLPYINATTTEKQQFRTDWQSQFETRQALTKPIDSEIVDYSLELTDPNSQRYTFDKGDGQKFAYAASPYYVVKVGLKPVPIDGFVNDNGNVYAVPKGQLKILDGGKFDWDKATLIPITDPSSQFITPTLSLQGRSSEQIQDVQNYGNRVDIENKLKIPKGQNVTIKTGTSSSSGNTQSGTKQIPPIPIGFTEIREQNGKLYFVNSQTKKVQLIGDASEYAK